MVNPFAAMRQKQMFQQPVNRQSPIGGFNPAMEDQSNPFPIPQSGFEGLGPPEPPPPPPPPPKRFQTGTDPTAQAKQGMINAVGNIKKMGGDVGSYNPEFPTPQTASNFDPSAYFKQAQAMRNEARPLKSEYQEALTTGRPTPVDYDPSKRRRLAAIIGGAAGGLAAGPGAGIKTAQTILEQPYVRVMNDYQQRIAGLKDAAGIEAQELDAKLGDLKASHDLNIEYTGVGQKQQEIDIKGVDAVTRAKDVVSEHMKRVADINHQLNQDIDAVTKSNLEQQKNDSLVKLQAAQADLAKANAAAAPRHAQAHEDTAKAAGVAARRPLGGGTTAGKIVSADMTVAGKKALANLANNKELYDKGIIVSDGSGGFTVDQDEAAGYVGPGGKTVTEMIEEETERILREMGRNVPGAAPTSGDDDVKIIRSDPGDRMP